MRPQGYARLLREQSNLVVFSLISRLIMASYNRCPLIVRRPGAPLEIHEVVACKMLLVSVHLPGFSVIL